GALKPIYVREIVANVAHPKLAGDVGNDIRSHHPAQELGDLHHRARGAGADVENHAFLRWILHAPEDGFGDISYMNEVAALPAVLEDRERKAAPDPGREYRQYARVGIRQRLALA